MVINNTKFKDLIGAYDFYATPDGEECLPKTYYYTKYGGIIGSVFSIVEICCVSQPSTLYGSLTRFGHFTLPVAGMGFVFGSSLCMLAQARKKDDIYNHIIAGALAGSVYGFKYNRIYPGHAWGLFLGFLAGYHKFFHVNNYPMLEFRTEASQKASSFYDYSIKLYDDPGRPNRV